MKSQSSSFPEFVGLMALLTSLVALSIDAMLPALEIMGRELGRDRANDHQLVVGVLFAGLTLGQLFYGPFSDVRGRRPAVFLGLGIYLGGTLMCYWASDFTWLLWGRFVQGLGVAGARVSALALIRDRFEGATMARVTSFITAVFILVPALAPSLGQWLLGWGDWRTIFSTFFVLGALCLVWFAWRQEETLPASRRRAFTWGSLWEGILIVIRHPVSFGYTIAAGFIFGAFISYLNSAPQIFSDVFGIVEDFPLYFGVMALSSGLASLVNAKLVQRFPIAELCRAALGVIIVSSLLLLLSVLISGAQPSLGVFVGYVLVVFFCTGLLFGNFNALAMEPMRARAGLAASVIGSLTSLISTLLGVFFGQMYDRTVLPLCMGFAALSGLSLFLVQRTERARRALLTSRADSAP